MSCKCQYLYVQEEYYSLISRINKNNDYNIKNIILYMNNISSDCKINMYDEVNIMKLMNYKELLNSYADLQRAKLIIDSKGFYFEKAIDKYNEYKNLEVKESILNMLIDKTKAKPFSYKKLLKEYSTDSIEYKVLLVIGELVILTQRLL